MLFTAPRKGPARLHYDANHFRTLTPGDHVRCAVTDAVIPIDELRYWSVARQEAYVDAADALKAEHGLAVRPSSDDSGR